MNLIEALTALKEGKRIRKKTWEFTEYVYLDKDGVLNDDNNDECSIFFNLGNLNRDDWKIVETPILDEQEKKYLNLVLNPLTKVMEIAKINCSDMSGKRFERIVGYENSKTYLPCLELPKFLPGAMYHGMELNKRYIIKELFEMDS